MLTKQLILKAEESTGEGPHLEQGYFMPPQKALRILPRLDELIIWCCMSCTPRKSSSLPLKKRKVAGVRHSVANQQIPAGKANEKSRQKTDVSMKISVAIKQLCEMD